MSTGPEIPFREFLDCRDAEGNMIRVGAGATDDGRVVLLAPSGHVPILNLKEATEYVSNLRKAIQDAAPRGR